MVLEIHHQSSYSYDSLVFLEPQHFYFHPLHRSYLKLLSFELSTDPKPKLFSERLDLENNTFHQYWFDESLANLVITASIKVETAPFNAFKFLEETQAKTEEIHAQQLYLNKLQLSSALVNWSDKIYQQNDQTISFLSELCTSINKQWDHRARYDNSLDHPDDCFDKKEGSCRDLSWMLIQLLRHHGMPARFVSGYSFNEELGEGHELHAWVEVFVNGAGWLGVDPSSGLFTTELYIPVATSYHPTNTLPVQGAYRGSAESKLETKVEVKVA